MKQEDVGYYFGHKKDGRDTARKQMGKWLIDGGRDPLSLVGDQDEGGVQEFMQAAVHKYNALDIKFSPIPRPFIPVGRATWRDGDDSFEIYEHTGRITECVHILRADDDGDGVP